MVKATLKDLEQAVFMKGGSIVPILMHQDCMALTQCINNKISLHVYLDESGQASGSLYVDDGLSHRYQTHSEYARVQFDMISENEGLKSSRIEENQYVFPESQTVETITFYGLGRAPHGAF